MYLELVVFLICYYKQNYVQQFLFQLSQLLLHEIPNEEVEQLKTYTDEEFSRNVQNVMRELNSNEAQLKAAGNPNLNILKVTYNFDRNLTTPRLFF